MLFKASLLAVLLVVTERKKGAAIIVNPVSYADGVLKLCVGKPFFLNSKDTCIFNLDLLMKKRLGKTVCIQEDISN